MSKHDFFNVIWKLSEQHFKLKYLIQNSDHIQYLNHHKSIVIVINNVIHILKIKNILKEKFLFKFVVALNHPKNISFKDVGEKKQYYYIKKKLKKLDSTKKKKNQSNSIEKSVLFFKNKEYRYNF